MLQTSDCSRGAVGLTMCAHGYHHVWGVGKINGTARWFESLGMKPGSLHAWLASTPELAAGALLVLGLLTPLAAGACAGVMLMAWITNHRKNGFFIFRSGEGWEYVMNLAVTTLALAAIGAGQWLLDAVLGLDETFAGWTGAALGAGVGIGGTIALLSGFWRPAPAPSG